MSKNRTSNPETMSIGDHLEELRKRIIWCIIPPLPLAIFFFLVADSIVRWFLVPLYTVLENHGLPTQVQVLSPPEFLIAEMKIAFGAAVLTAGPWILYQLWRFVSPGLHRHERRFVFFLIPFSTLLGILGLILMYFVMLPVILDFMVTLAGSVEMNTTTISVGESMSDVVYPVLSANPETASVGDAWIKMPEGILTVAVESPEIDTLDTLTIPMSQGSLISQQFQLSSYLGFVILLMFAIAVAFQLPMVMLLLGWLGVAKPQWLRKNRRYALIVLSLISALITPQDVISMLMMLVPLYLLYELGIQLIVWVPMSRVAGDIEDE
ncbi:MAG: preprotein translocase subunit TatC [Phycisphaerales bacterium]|nr:preprotein translocase subunit TatC [Planctomycetota bacterium]MBL6996859.1 preprotein translocase subunit TatC [Phycisphaerales bacterium]